MTTASTTRRRAINHLDIVVFDLETGGLDPDHNEAIQVAGKAYSARNLEPYPAEEGGEFSSMMKPLYPERLEDKALQVNKKSREEILAAPEQKLVWNQFVDWVLKWNPKKTHFTAPIACGKNIRDFDMKFVNNLNRLHCKKKDKTVLFNRRRQLELEDYIFAWFENSEELPDEKMDTLREYFGMDTAGAHDALVDVRQTGKLVTKFLKLHRELCSRSCQDGTKLIKFKDAFRKGKVS
jgi:DNA polymerase III epsilon subunit-like protein